MDSAGEISREIDSLEENLEEERSLDDALASFGKIVKAYAKFKESK